MTDKRDLVERVARSLCYHGQYWDNGPYEAEEVVCQTCGGPDRCSDWDIHSFGYKRMARAAITETLEEAAKIAEEELMGDEADYTIGMIARAIRRRALTLKKDSDG